MRRSTRFVITEHPAGVASEAETCEHKGIGHPDSLCDGAAEAVSRALCRAYLTAYGHVQHYNVDKALLIGGESKPRFGGGALVTRPHLIICGRATALPGVDMADFVVSAAREYVRSVIPDADKVFTVESAVRAGSPNLQRVVGDGKTLPRANDTSFGAGFAPYSMLENLALKAAALLRSEDLRTRFPAAGYDYKVMGCRIGAEQRLTIALAFVASRCANAKEYFAAKAGVRAYLREQLDFDGRLVINALDDPHAADESGIYLTVTGLSAEHGDDGQVGRGNRVNGLITPGRAMSLEATAGKNSVAHVGKLYNLLAHDIAHAIAVEHPEVAEASVTILSTIGKPVDEPELIAIRLTPRRRLNAVAPKSALRIARERLRKVSEISRDLIEGRRAVF